MMKVLFPALFLYTFSAFATGKPQYIYQDGVLQGFQREPAETDCVAPSSSGTATRKETTSCKDEYTIVFTVQSGGATYILTPRGDADESKCGLLLRSTIPHSVLANRPLHTLIKIRSDGRHFFVKVGDRESEYSVARIE